MQMNNPQQENEEEYVPPGKRLVTPADVVELDPNMTVDNGRIGLLIGAISCGNPREQSNSY